MGLTGQKILLPPVALFPSSSHHFLRLLSHHCGMSGQDNRREGERSETERGSINIRWHLGVYCKSLPQGHLLPPPSDCPSDSSNQGCAQTLKLQPPTDHILAIISTDQLTVVELTIFAFMAPFEVNATLIIGQGPVCRIVIRVILIPLAAFPTHKSLFEPQACKNVCFSIDTLPKEFNFITENADQIKRTLKWLNVSSSLTFFGSFP